jgi:uncharacterized protein involved in oxidation of intracellular sulfur
VKDILLIINGPAYGSDDTYNAVRLAVELAARDDTAVRVFLMGDAVTCAASGQKTPDGYYALDRMLASFSRKGANLACCGTCLDAKGMTADRLIPQANRSTMDELARWTVEADQVLTF